MTEAEQRYLQQKYPQYFQNAEEKKRKEAEAQTLADKKKQKEILTQIKNQRRIAQIEGRNIGKKYFGDEKLGRVDETRSNEVAKIIAERQAQLDAAKTRTADTQQIIDLRKANLAGFSPEEINAMRAQEVSQMGRAQSTALRQLRGAQAQAGLRGGAAAAQQANILAQSQAARANVERDLFLQNIAQRRAALGDYESSVRGVEGEEFARRTGALGGLEASTQGARADELARQQFNLAQLGRERFGQASSEFGYAGLGQQEAQAALQTILGEKQSEATVEAAKHSGK